MYNSPRNKPGQVLIDHSDKPISTLSMQAWANSAVKKPNRRKA
jgi:hypothetical protein